MAIASATYLFGPQQQPVQLPDYLRGQVHVSGLDLGAYRLFLIAVVAVIAPVDLCADRAHALRRARFARRSTTSRRRRGMGINVDRVFSLTFALGSGTGGSGWRTRHRRARPGPDISAQVHGVFPARRRRRRRRHHRGPLFAALILGVFDVAGKYYVPQLGPFIIYVVMVAMLLIFPRGCVGRRGMKGAGLPTRAGAKFEIGFWLVPVIAFFVFPKYLTLGSQILIAGLFAMSLDLILGYARIISLGQRHFSAWAHTRRDCWPSTGGVSPQRACCVAAIVAAILGLVTSFLVVRGQDLTRLMVTLGIGLMLYEVANRRPRSPAASMACPASTMWPISASSHLA